jgi:hypothetical protein
MFTLKARFTKPISKIYGYYFATLCSSLYKTLGWETMLFIQNSFGNTCVVMECRDVGVEVEKWRMEMFMKNAHCVFVL